MNKDFIKSKLLELGDSINLEYLDEYIEFCISNHEPDIFKGANHHILSAKLFPEYKNFKENSWNLSRLSNYNHYIAHAILFKSINNSTFGFAWYAMNNKNFILEKDKPIELIGPNLYDELILKRNKLCSDINIGKVMAKDLTTGKNIKVTKDVFYSDDNLVGYTYNKLCAKDIITNERVYVTKEVFYSDDNLVGINLGNVLTTKKGMFAAKDCDGHIYYISNTDEKYLLGELMAINKGRQFNKDFGKKIAESMKLTGHGIGSRNPRANIIIIFNNKDEPIYFAHGNFYNMCKENNLPNQLFQKSYSDNTILDFTIYNKEWQTRYKGMGYGKYSGWYARKMKRIKI